MKQNYLFLFLFSLILFSCKNGVNGEGDAQMALDFKVEPFNAVTAAGKFKLILIPNDSSYVSVQTHKNLIENMDIYVQSGTLNLKEKKSVDSFESYVVYLYFNRDLKEIDIAQKVLLESSSTLTFEKIDISAEDEAVVRQFVMNAKEADLSVDDKAEMSIGGNATTVDLKSKGYAKVELEALNTKVLEVDLSGETDVLANVNKELKGRVLENATLTYIGSAIKDVDVKDNGEILNK